MRKIISVTGFVSFILLVLLLSNSCKKISDKTPEKPPVSSERNEDLFLKIPENASPQLTDLINEIKRIDDKHHFLNEFAKNNGLPLWNKVIANVPITKVSTPVIPTGRIAGSGNENGCKCQISLSYARYFKWCAINDGPTSWKSSKLYKSSYC